MVGNTLITGSDDWTARIWSLSRGTCDAVLACHASPILCVEYSTPDKGVITGLLPHFFLRYASSFIFIFSSTQMYPLEVLLKNIYLF